MKKHLFYNVFTILMVVFASFSFTACGDDDDEGGSGGDSQNVLVGSWYTSWDKDTSSSGTSGNETWTFKNDGTGSTSGTNQSYDRYGKKDGSPYTWNDSFRYELIEYDTYLKTGTFMIRYSGSSNYSTKTFEISGNKLIMDGATYTKR